MSDQGKVKQTTAVAASTEAAAASATAVATAASTHEQYVKLMREKLTRGEKQIDKNHIFWDTQPVPKMGEAFDDNGPIDDAKTPADVKQDGYAMPKGFKWVSVDITNDDQLQEVYTLLTENYVEDDDNMFRFDYSKEFLRWALMPPGYLVDWHLGVRTTNNNKLVGFITAIPADISIHERVERMAEINFLCVHKKLRAKRLAPVLIKEITRRVNITNVWQAVYTAGVVIPKPVSKCRYWHRSLNPKKLFEVKFSRLGDRMTLARAIKLYKVSEQPHHALVPMEACDVAGVTILLANYLRRTKLHPVLNEDEVAHWLLPRPGVIQSFVIRDPASGNVTDFCSFYHLPSTIIGHEKYNSLNAAYSYYNVPTTVSMFDLFRDLLVMAKQQDVDVFNCLDLMENSQILADLKFGAGDGNLQYYLYNWKCPEIQPAETGLVLL